MSQIIEAVYNFERQLFNLGFYCQNVSYSDKLFLFSCRKLQYYD